MGQRHASGIANIEEVSRISIVDISVEALSSAKETLPASDKFEFLLRDDIGPEYSFDVGIIAATAQNRMESCEFAVKHGCRHLLIEKPLGQSLSELEELINFFEGTNCKASVNLNMRVYPDSIKLKNDLNTMSQMRGVKNVTINTGTVGIGANGIHYLDYLVFLSGADSAEIMYGEIDKVTIPSARGPQFKDFGGRVFIKFYRAGELLLNAFISIGSKSTVFGGWDIVGAHGRITINESTGKRIDYMRKEDSEMPIQRYNADYQKPVEIPFDSPYLGDLTNIWVRGIIKGEETLPSLKTAVLSHRLMFDWLSFSTDFKRTFPIT